MTIAEEQLAVALSLRDLEAKRDLDSFVDLLSADPAFKWKFLPASMENMEKDVWSKSEIVNMFREVSKTQYRSGVRCPPFEGFA